MNPKYVATRSALSDFSFFFCVLLLILGIIPGVLYIVIKKAAAHSYRINFYDDKYVLKSGILNKSETSTVFKGVVGVSVEQSIKGRMFDYGIVKVDLVGKHQLVLGGVKNPAGLKKYLETRKVDVSTVKHVMND